MAAAAHRIAETSTSFLKGLKAEGSNPPATVGSSDALYVYNLTVRCSSGNNSKSRIDLVYGPYPRFEVNRNVAN